MSDESEKGPLPEDDAKAPSPSKPRRIQEIPAKPSSQQDSWGPIAPDEPVSESGVAKAAEPAPAAANVSWGNPLDEWDEEDRRSVIHREIPEETDGWDDAAGPRVSIFMALARTNIGGFIRYWGQPLYMGILMVVGVIASVVIFHGKAEWIITGSLAVLTATTAFLSAMMDYKIHQRFEIGCFWVAAMILAALALALRAIALLK